MLLFWTILPRSWWWWTWLILFLLCLLPSFVLFLFVLWGILFLFLLLFGFLYFFILLLFSSVLFVLIQIIFLRIIHFTFWTIIFLIFLTFLTIFIVFITIFNLNACLRARWFCLHHRHASHTCHILLLLDLFIAESFLILSVIPMFLFFRHKMLFTNLVEKWMPDCILYWYSCFWLQA